MAQGTGRKSAKGQVTSLPDRFRTVDFFMSDICDAAPKDDVASMENPVFSHVTRPDRRELSYVKNGAEERIMPSINGRTMIHEKAHPGRPGAHARDDRT